jgi:hypothetical protein
LLETSVMRRALKRLDLAQALRRPTTIRRAMIARGPEGTSTAAPRSSPPRGRAGAASASANRKVSISVLTPAFVAARQIGDRVNDPLLLQDGYPMGFGLATWIAARPARR